MAQGDVISSWTDIVFTANTLMGDGPDIGVLKENSVERRVSYYRKDRLPNDPKDMDFVVRITAEQYNEITQGFL